MDSGGQPHAPRRCWRSREMVLSSESCLPSDLEIESQVKYVVLRINRSCTPPQVGLGWPNVLGTSKGKSPSWFRRGNANGYSVVSSGSRDVLRDAAPVRPVPSERP